MASCRCHHRIRDSLRDCSPGLRSRSRCRHRGEAGSDLVGAVPLQTSDILAVIVFPAIEHPEEEFTRFVSGETVCAERLAACITAGIAQIEIKRVAVVAIGMAIKAVVIFSAAQRLAFIRVAILRACLRSLSDLA